MPHEQTIADYLALLADASAALAPFARIAEANIMKADNEEATTGGLPEPRVGDYRLAKVVLQRIEAMMDRAGNR